MSVLQLPPHIFFSFLAGICLLFKLGDGGKAFFFAAFFAKGQVTLSGKPHADTYVKQKTAAGLDAAAVSTAGQQLRCVYEEGCQKDQNNFNHEGNIHSGLYLCAKNGRHANNMQYVNCKKAVPVFGTAFLFYG